MLGGESVEVSRGRPGAHHSDAEKALEKINTQL